MQQSTHLVQCQRGPLPNQAHRQIRPTAKTGPVARLGYVQCRARCQIRLMGFSGTAQAMKFLQQAVGLRGYAQRDPLAEYKVEGYNLFMEMMAQIRRNVIYNVYVFRPQKPRSPAGDQKQEAAEKTAVVA